nr:coiled-coil domain-containing protein 191 [Nomia melanderi]
MIRAELTDLLDRMMKTDIFHPSEKLRMIRDEEKSFLDPNLIMDARHRILREDLSVSPTKCSVLAEAKRLFTEEEDAKSYMKKQQRFLERELKRFEMEVLRSRPKFSRPYTCKRRTFAPSDDEEFWSACRRAKRKISEDTERSSQDRLADAPWKKSMLPKADSALNDEKVENSEPPLGSIKVTITDKPNSEAELQRLDVLRKCFDALRSNAEEERRLRDIKTKIQQSVTSRITRKYFDIWRTRLRNETNDAQEEKEDPRVSEERKIELFINAITEHQKELMRTKKPRGKDDGPAAREFDTVTRRRSTVFKAVAAESPAQSRLSAQKKIIESQRAKLAEQNKIIEELKLRETQKEIYRSSKETVHVVKETLTHCGKMTRRTLIQLMQQAGYRDESLTVPHQAPGAPKFLLRMEARAEARRERVKLAEESRRRKLEEQKMREEAARLEEEQKKRRLQQEAAAEARRLRREQEQNRLREIERHNRLNNIADQFYRRYLLRRYLIEPLIALVERKKSNVRKADDHYRETLTRKIFVAWRRETEAELLARITIAESVYNKRLTISAFGEWRRMVKEENLKYQVATDFCEIKLLDRYFALWRTVTLELKAERERNEELAGRHYVNQLKRRYLFTWRRYLAIAADITESEKRRNELRQLVQTVIPDFNPKQRGVALED